MKTKLISKLVIIPAFLLSMGMMYAQNNQNNTNTEKTIRIKMVKNINGVETVFDTTIVGDDLSAFEDIHDMPTIEIEMDSTHTMQGDHQMIVKTIDINGMNDSNVVIKVIEGNDPELDKIMKENGIYVKDGKMEKRVIIINDENTTGDNKDKGNYKMELRVIVKSCNISELNKEDKKLLRSENKSFNENLKIDQVDFYPNPNNGRFNISFHLQNTGDTEISIFNIEGKRVYQELLKDFTGGYKNEIDISKQAAGIYYIKVTQGKDSWFKKMIIE